MKTTGNLLMLALIAVGASGAPAVGTLTATAVLSNGSYQVTASCQPSTGTPALIANGLNLLRVDVTPPQILGTMQSTGQGVYSLTFTATSASIGQIQLQAAGAFSGVLRRVKSAVVSVTIVAPTISQVLPATGAQGAQNLSVAITGQYTHFAQGTTVAGFGSNLTVVSLTVNSTTSATAVIDIPATAPLGAVNVTMTTGSEAPVAANGFTVTTATLPGDVYTWHYDNTRSGVNPNETTLTTSNVNAASFGKVAEFTVDGAIYGQILYLHQVNMPSVGPKNVVYFATENDSVYALDAASMSGSNATVLWQTSLLGSGETAVASNPNVTCGNITPSGVTATPVIDRARNAVYVVSRSQDASYNVYYRLHALDLTTGDELFSGPKTITATFPGTGGNVVGGMVIFDANVQQERAALLETGNQIYTVWSGQDGDCGPYSPWVIAYSADTLDQTAALDLAPDYSGGGMWMGGAGPAVDSAGYIYTITGNGFGGSESDEGGTPPASYNNSIVKLSTSSGLSVADYFTPYNTISENQGDLDMGSAGPMLLPDQVDNSGGTHQLTIAAGKDGQMYVINRNSMGEFNTSTNNVYQQFTLAPSVNISTPVYFNGTVYLCVNGLRAFTLSNAMLPTTPTMTSTSVGAAVVTISSNGTSDGIVWLLQQGTGQAGTATLWAFDATTFHTALYSSATGVISGALSTRFNTPTVVDGRVYFGTLTGTTSGGTATPATLVVFGIQK